MRISSEEAVRVGKEIGQALVEDVRQAWRENGIHPIQESMARTRREGTEIENQELTETENLILEGSAEDFQLQLAAKIEETYDNVCLHRTSPTRVIFECDQGIFMARINWDEKGVFSIGETEPFKIIYASEKNSRRILESFDPRASQYRRTAEIAGLVKDKTKPIELTPRERNLLTEDQKRMRVLAGLDEPFAPEDGELLTE